jgi:CheY-like chemotaxis protein
MAVRILEDAGYAVLAAGSCAEALHLCRESGDELDLLLTDVRMPGMTGLDLAERITALRPQLPVLFMSGYSPGALPKRSVGQGGDRRFVQKPFTREALLREVRAALGS